MNSSTRAREIETLLLTMYAAVPFYFTAAIGIVPVFLFHLVMAGIIIRVALGKGPELIPAQLMRVLAFACVPLYVVDAIVSRSAIAASTHLVLFIAAYQPIESVRTNNQSQRLLTTALIFVASVATSTHISIVLFVLSVAFLMFRQLMFLSHLETVRSMGRPAAQPPTARAATFYLCGTALIGTLLFPLLPRVRNPLVQGVVGALTNASTGLSESIDFSEERSSAVGDSTVVARVWMGPETIPFFMPLRLRGAVYDRFSNNRWLQSREFRGVGGRDGSFRLARPVGYTGVATVQQRMVRQTRLFFPVGTYSVSGLTQLYEGPQREAYMTFRSSRDVVAYQARMARDVSPIRVPEIESNGFPVTPAIAAMARQIVGSETNPFRQAVAIERHLTRNFEYYQRPEQIGRPLTVEEFLLKEKRGHCEYFAAGMVGLLTALDARARIVGGFYGGRFNPLGGYFLVRREDAHAWVEVWDGGKWVTFDPTPSSLRPGSAQSSVLGLYATALSDSINYFWDRYILTFGLADQIALATDAIDRLRQTSGTLRRGLSGGINDLADPRWLLVLVVAFAAFALLRRPRRSLFDDLARHLAALGIEIGPAMTMEEALDRLRADHPEAAGNLAPLIELYEAERFSPRKDRRRVATIRRKLAELRA